MLPVKEKKLKVTNRYFHYLIFSDEQQHTILSKRTQKGIWHNLYEFPLLETVAPEADETIIALIENQTFVANAIEDIALYTSETILHKLSHQHLHIQFWQVKVKGILLNGIDCESAAKFPFPIVVFNFIEKVWP